jgi:LmbE family N-acetylglucosaminyl deacetylase
MLIAPHPDDEALACSVILQKAVAAGAAIRVVYATDGEDNPWPQRLLERKWRLHARDRERWGALRHDEAVAALRALGVNPADAGFLGLPDQKLTRLLTSDCRSIIALWLRLITEWRPTDLLVPSIYDTHPDHSALAVMLRLALHGRIGESDLSVWSYVVHGDSRSFFDHAQPIPQSQTETATKLAAIRCHKTQLHLSRKRFRAYSTRPERLLQLGSAEATANERVMRAVARQPGFVRILVKLSRKPMRHSRSAFLLLGRSENGALRCITWRLAHRSASVEVRDCVSDRPIASGRYHGNGSAGEFMIPTGIFSSGHPLFLKLELRLRLRFFDEAGWSEVPPVHAAECAQQTHPSAEKLILSSR